MRNALRRRPKKHVEEQRRPRICAGSVRFHKGRVQLPVDGVDAPKHAREEARACVANSLGLSRVELRRRRGAAAEAAGEDVGVDDERKRGELGRGAAAAFGAFERALERFGELWRRGGEQRDAGVFVSRERLVAGLRHEIGAADGLCQRVVQRVQQRRAARRELAGQPRLLDGGVAGGRLDVERAEAPARGGLEAVEPLRFVELPRARGPFLDVELEVFIKSLHCGTYLGRRPRRKAAVRRAYETGVEALVRLPARLRVERPG
mmetsp:Transcript_1586/g.5805  ORF Transcript_1586/g.5805 Transcript_1586/m.5805 type:complete len:263 (+) Transcript_1586:314-1102(+)